MKKLSIFLGVCVYFLAGLTTSMAGDLNWSGLYRIEADMVRNSTLVGSNAPQKDYIQHHLILRPQMIVADGITVRSRFDLFNDPNKFSQGGQFFGSNGTNNAATPGGDPNSSALGTMNSGTLAVNELYLTWVQGFGTVIAGRAPVQFGLGITHNAGNGEFDHWFDVKDIIGYKMVLGNFSFIPMIGKVREDNLDVDDDVNEIMIQAMYENPETELTLGIFYEDRNAAQNGGDLSLTTNPYNSTVGTTANDSLDLRDINFFVKKKVGNLGFGVEAGYQSGTTGLKTAALESILVEGFALVGEINYAAPDSNWAWKLKLGSVSGNDPNTTKYEGYLLNRNYDVGILMFNHNMGQGNILGTNSFKSLSNLTSTDVEYLSNAIYVAPGFDWKWSDKWSMNGTLLYAQLNRTQYVNQTKNLGFEADLGITHKPHEHLTWRSEAGFLFPGDAWQGGVNTFNNNFAFGLMTKVAVSF